MEGKVSAGGERASWRLILDGARPGANPPTSRTALLAGLTLGCVYGLAQSVLEVAARTGSRRQAA